MQRGRDDEKKEEWTDCVQSNVRSFGIGGDWMATVLEAVVYVETVTEEGRELWPREAKQEMRLECQKKREANETGKAVNVQGKLVTQGQASVKPPKQNRVSYLKRRRNPVRTRVDRSLRRG